MARAVSSIAFTVTSFALRGRVGQPFPLAAWDRQAGAPALQVWSRESIASIFGRGGRFLSQRMNDEADHCDTDAGIGDVEGRPGIGKANM
jgi:hypothetical protein